MTTNQQAAIDSPAKQICCVAGPGAGKTTVLVARIRRLVTDGADPGKMSVITFTNAAARELDDRLNTIEVKDGIAQQTAPGALGYCGTLHGFALRCLKEYGSGMGYGRRMSIIGEEAAADLLLSKAQLLACKTPLDKLLKLKAAGPGKRTKARLTVEELTIREYYNDLALAGMVDFDTMLTEFHRLITSEVLGASLKEFTHLFVDEVQDSGVTDWAIYRALPIENKFFVGDPDQAIFGFRGGRPDLMVEYARGGCTEICLEENFRSHAEICGAANRLIRHNQNRLIKDTIGVKGDGGRISRLFACNNPGEEIARIQATIQGNYHPDSCSEVAILARTNHQCREIRDALKGAGIPVAEAAKSGLPKDWPLARSLVELLASPENDTLAFFYLIQRKLAAGMPAGRAREYAHMLKQAATLAGKSLNTTSLFFDRSVNVHQILNREGISLEAQRRVMLLDRQLGGGTDPLQLALAMGQNNTPAVAETEGVTVCTFHAAKGREWDVVFLVGMEDEMMPGKRVDTDVEEERRLCYVGLTRARKTVYVSCVASRMTEWKGWQTCTPSRFLQEIFP